MYSDDGGVLSSHDQYYRECLEEVNSTVLEMFSS